MQLSTNNDTHIIVSIADIHFGATDPLYMYNILKEQFLDVIDRINFDIVTICGDIFDSKFMSNNPIISYALMFIDNLVQICRKKNAALVIIDGTQSHDNGQLKLFYHYLSDSSLDMYIIEEIKIINVKNMKVLCIPERYGISEEIYKQWLFESGGYDMCLLHGTFHNSFKGTEISTLKSDHAPVFSLSSFCNCSGPILMGHYHISGCYDGYAYYNGSPLRWRFGEEQDKGFLVTLYNQTTKWHYTELVPIVSNSYVTISIDDIISQEPHIIIEYIQRYKTEHNIDYIRVQFNNSNDSMAIVKNYFRTNQNVVLQEMDRQVKQMESINKGIMEQQSQYSYIIDPQLDDYTKFIMYINQCEGCEFITVDELIHILEEVN